MGSLGSFQKQLVRLKDAHQERENLFEDLLTKVEELEKQLAASDSKLRHSEELVTLYDDRQLEAKLELTKTRGLMKSNSFVVALIDGDCMPFDDNLVMNGEEGGREAASRLRTAVTKHLEQQKADWHGFDILVRVYANSNGLSRNYAGNKILKTPAQFELFVRGFNSNHALCDFVDSGEGKECADEKLRACLKHYIESVHCRYVVFGGSGDNGYARLLGPYSDDAAIRERICMVEGPRLARELAALANKFSVTSFPQVFRASKLPTQRTSFSQHLTSQTVPNPTTLTYASTASQAHNAPPSIIPTRVPVQGRDVPLQRQAVSQSQSQSQRKKNPVLQNSKGERIDSILRPNEAFVAAQKKFKACNAYQLNGTCPYEKCSYSHEEMSETELEARRFIARLNPCDRGLACEDPSCLFGHHCPRSNCQWGSECKFSTEMHNVSREGIRPLP